MIIVIIDLLFQFKSRLKTHKFSKYSFSIWVNVWTLSMLLFFFLYSNQIILCWLFTIINFSGFPCVCVCVDFYVYMFLYAFGCAFCVFLKIIATIESVRLLEIVFLSLYMECMNVMCRQIINSTNWMNAHIWMTEWMIDWMIESMICRHTKWAEFTSERCSCIGNVCTAIAERISWGG